MLSTKLRLFPDHRGGAASSARGEAPFYQRRGLQPVQCPPIDKESMKAPVVRPGLVGENTSRGVLDAPILSQSVRRAIIRKHETRNQKD